MSDYDYHHPSRELSQLLQSHNIRGIYELDVPYIYKALIKIGCLARVNKMQRFKNTTSFNLDDIEFLSTTGYNYLTPESSTYIKLFLYCIENKDRGLWLLFNIQPDDNNIKLYTWEITSNDDITNVRYKSLFNDIKNKYESNYNISTVTVNKVKNKNEFFSSFNSFIMDYQVYFILFISLVKKVQQQ